MPHNPARTARWPGAIARARCAVLLLCGCDPIGVARSARPIVDGVEDSGDPAVVALVVNERIECSGVLVGDRVVVTAAHCVDDVDPEGLGVLFGASLQNGGQIMGVSDIRPHAEFTRTPTQANDIAAILLDGVAPAAPVPLLRTAMPETMVGDQVRIVGFGRTSPTDSDPRLKREGTAQISSIDDTTFAIKPDPSITCVGDSGGPAFVDVGGEVLAGVLSLGDPDCATVSVDTRVDAYAAAFLDPYVAATEPGVAGLGERCFYDDNCSSGTCLRAIDIPAFGFCTKTCETQGDCPAPLVCETESALAGYCRHELPSPGALGTLCVDSYGCAERTSGDPPLRTWCDSPAGGAPDRCTVECDPEGDLSCPEGYGCVRSERDGAYACFVGETEGCTCRAGRGARLPATPWLLVILCTIGRATAARRKRW